MKNRVLATSLLASSISLASLPTYATEIRIDGFASLVYGQALDKDEGSSAFNGRDYGNRGDFQHDSLYAIQFRADLTEGLSATAQFTGKGQENFDAKVSWAYFTYQLNDSWSLKAGRQRLPYFLYSDFLDVGYAYHWIAPPSEVYDLGGFDNLDGVNLEYYGDWGAVTSRVSIIAGATTTESGDLDVASEDHWVVSWNMNWEWLTFQASYSESIVTVEGINAAANGIATIASEAGLPMTSDQIDYINMENDKGHFAGIGVSADFGNWFAGAEFTETGVENSPLNNEKQSWYVTGGFRAGKTTVSLTYANADNPNNPDSIAALTDDLSPFAPGFSAMALLTGAASSGDPFTETAANALIDTVNDVIIAGFEAESINLTIRYDFHPSAAFKFDYTQEEADYEDINGNITTREPSLVRMGVDLVF